MYKSNFITIPIESARNAYYHEFHDKLIVIPQGFNFESIQRHRNFVKNKIPTFAYAGGFIPKRRDPRPFLDYLAKVENDFRFVIYTNKPDLLTLYKVKLRDKLQIESKIPRSELLKVLSKMDFLVNFDNNAHAQVPSKLIDYALTNRPVLNISNDFNPEIVDEFLAGNYKHKFVVTDLEKYNIINVAQQFLDLIG